MAGFRRIFVFSKWSGPSRYRNFWRVLCNLQVMLTAIQLLYMLHMLLLHNDHPCSKPSISARIYNIFTHLAHVIDNLASFCYFTKVLLSYCLKWISSISAACHSSMPFINRLIFCVWCLSQSSKCIQMMPTHTYFVFTMENQCIYIHFMLENHQNCRKTAKNIQNPTTLSSTNLDFKLKPRVFLSIQSFLYIYTYLIMQYFISTGTSYYQYWKKTRRHCKFCHIIDLLWKLSVL